MKLKSIFTIILLTFIIQQTYARKSQPFEFYHIISDSIDDSVPEGKCLIVGTVFKDGLTVNQAIIESEKHKKTTSKKDGSFQLLIETSDLYLIIKNNAEEYSYVENYKFKNKHRIEINIYIPTLSDEQYIIVDKPVIYAYNQTSLGFSLKLNTACNLLFTYPKYEDIWNINIAKNGMLKSNNKEYPYLFWEGKLNDLTFKDENNALKGNPIKKENVVNFLEKSLSNLGLNAREQTDFITFWAPRMIQHNEVFVQFLIDDDYDVISTMEITPKPDHIRRIYLLYTAMENIPTETKLQQQDFDFAPLDRSGFTIIEWGGSEINNVVLSNN